MLRTGEEYRESIRDGREVYINGEKVEDVPTHPAFKPLVDIRARIYDMQHDPETRDVMTYEEDGERFSTGLKLPRTQHDWWQGESMHNAEPHVISTRISKCYHFSELKSDIPLYLFEMESPCILNIFRE